MNRNIVRGIIAILLVIGGFGCWYINFKVIPVNSAENWKQNLLWIVGIPAPLFILASVIAMSISSAWSRSTNNFQEGEA